MHINKQLLAHCAPFVFYIIIMVMSGMLSTTGLDTRWLYGVRILGVLLLLRIFWSYYDELNTKQSLSTRNMLISIGLGILVFVVWINLNQSWMLVGAVDGYDPHGKNGELNYLMIAMRIAGAALVVPIMEELFWRSFLMRWIDYIDFNQYAVQAVTLKAILISSIIFASEHTYWLAGLFAGLVYAFIYIKTQNLWAAIISHGVTNLLLGCWVVYSQQWQYW